MQQTQRPQKLLVIDDGSRDGSPAIAERVLKDCDFDAELIVRENRGLCRTLNQGLELSSGEYFAYLGSDDIWMPEFIEQRTRLLRFREDAVIGYGHAYLIDDQDRVFGCTADFDADWAKYADGDPHAMLLIGVSPVSSTVMYRRGLLTTSPWNEEARLEDYEMYVRLMPLGEFAFDPQPLSAWRHHSYNTSRDLMLMHNEVLAAQARNRSFLRVGDIELQRAQIKMRFRYGQELMQHGRKREALALFLKSWRGADSPANFVKPTVQLIVPAGISEAYRRWKRARLTKRYRDIKI
jgi:alpha-1,3-rhamnosyltransferase